MVGNKVNRGPEELILVCRTWNSGPEHWYDSIGFESSAVSRRAEK